MAKMLSEKRLCEVLESDPRPSAEIWEGFGVSKQTLSAWKNGTRSPKKSKLEEIAAYYGKDPLWFFGFEEKEDLPIKKEEDEQAEEILSLIRNLSEEKKAEAIRYLRYLSTSEGCV